MAYTWVRSAVTAGCANKKGSAMFIRYPRNLLAMVGNPYHNVCPASFFMPLNVNRFEA